MVFFASFSFAGDFIALEDKQQQENLASSNKGRFTQDTGDDDDISDDDRRVDMSAITGAKEREERREQFYSVQNKCMSLFMQLRILSNWRFFWKNSSFLKGFQL